MFPERHSPAAHVWLRCRMKLSPFDAICFQCQAPTETARTGVTEEWCDPNVSCSVLQWGVVVLQSLDFAACLRVLSSSLAVWRRTGRPDRVGFRTFGCCGFAGDAMIFHPFPSFRGKLRVSATQSPTNEAGPLPLTYSLCESQRGCNH